MKSIRMLSALLPLLAFTSVALALGDEKTPPAPAKEKTTETAKAAELGKPAPDFALTDVDGKTVKLSDYKGKTVVLEWFNPGCPFVKGAYAEGGALRGMASKTATDGIVWLSINSSAAGKEGSGAEMNKKMRDEWKMSNPLLLDETGAVGMSYGAKTTPHMFVIDAKGMLVYKGALDNAPMGKLADGEKERVNYVQAALSDLKAGKPVAIKETKSYGCTVKYGKPGA